MKPVIRTGAVTTVLAAALAVGCSTNELGVLEAQNVGDLSYAPVPKAAYDAALADACGPGGRTLAREAAIVRAPYLQQVTDSSALVLWTAASAEAPVLTLTRADNGESRDIPAVIDETASPANAVQYVASLTDLEPGTIYCYTVSDASGVLYETTGFETAPPTGGDVPVSFIAMGDLGEASGDQYAVLEQLQTVPFDFGLLTGDIAYTDGTLAQFETNYFGVYEDVIDEVPWFPATGNHDYETSQAGPYRQVFALPENGGPDGKELWYSFEWGNVHVVVLDSERIGQVQAEWADADLAATAQPWKIAVVHRPPYSSGHHGSDTAVRNTFDPIFEKHGVQLALFGHEHHYERTHPINGVTYLTTGGGGIGTRPVGQSSFTAFSEQVAHFVYVTVEDGKLTVYAIDATGQLFDTMQVTLGN